MYLTKRANNFTMELCGQTTSMNMMLNRVESIQCVYSSLIQCLIQVKIWLKLKLSLQVISTGIKKLKRKRKLFIRHSQMKMNRSRGGLSMDTFTRLKNVLIIFTRKFWKSNSFKIMKDNRKKCMKIIKLNCKGVFFGWAFFK